MLANSLIASYGLALVFSFLITICAIPSIILVAKRRLLFDEPDKVRKLHTCNIPNLGGIAIFMSMIFITALFASYYKITSWNYIFASCIILFITGLKDDIIVLSPVKKFVAQFLASFIIVYFANMRLIDLNGFFGIYQMPYWLSISFSIIGIMFVTNAFNLIDGIDGLAGGLALCIFTFYSVFFYLEHNTLAFFTISLMGALIGFLRYNIAPAKIFMGDNGSLLLGFLAAVFSIAFVNSSNISNVLESQSAPLVIAVALLIIPVFDTLRVFFSRIVKGKSPFEADRNHIHHLLIDLNLSHTQVSLLMLLAQITLVVEAYSMSSYNPTIVIAVLFATVFSLFGAVVYYKYLRLKATNPFISSIQALLAKEKTPKKTMLTQFEKEMAAETE